MLLYPPNRQIIKLLLNKKIYFCGFIADPCEYRVNFRVNLRVNGLCM